MLGILACWSCRLILIWCTCLKILVSKLHLRRHFVQITFEIFPIDIFSWDIIKPELHQISSSLIWAQIIWSMKNQIEFFKKMIWSNGYDSSTINDLWDTSFCKSETRVCQYFCIMSFDWIYKRNSNIRSYSHK